MRGIAKTLSTVTLSTMTPSMTIMCILMLSGVIALTMLTPGPASAQVRCPEGRTASGECVAPGLAARLRTTAVIFAQPNISHTAFPVLPADDRLYRYPNQVIPDQHKPSPAFSFRIQ